MEVSCDGENLQISALRLPDMHAEPINPFRVIRIVTSASLSKALFGISNDVF